MTNSRAKELLRDQLDFPIEEGEFIRWDSQFRNWITPDGSPGKSGSGGFNAEAGRYHLIVSYACPWAHRTLIFRKLKKLEDVISVSVVNPKMGHESWDFDEFPGATGDQLFNAKFLYELYHKVAPQYGGVVTVPVLWDKKLNTIVNNESSEIIRMLNSSFNEFTDVKDDYFPEALRGEIEKINTMIYDDINNGVYKTGFARSQLAYEKAFTNLFNALDQLEAILDKQCYLVGEQITEADWRLFPTLIRFDAVYVGHFKCNLRRIADYPNLSNYLRELYQHPGIAETVNLDHIKTHYYWSHESINPTRIIPRGPELDFTVAHNRKKKFPAG